MHGQTMTGGAWLDATGLVTLPSGISVRGRRLSDSVSPADFTLMLADGPVPAGPHRHIRWPDFWIPIDRDDALDALHDASRRAHAGQRVEVACHGGIGRTGTALAALAILDGFTPRQALSWVRGNYHPRAVETPWQRRWLRHVR
jgi:Protein-tyrosine phosphatase